MSAVKKTYAGLALAVCLAAAFYFLQRSRNDTPASPADTTGVTARFVDEGRCAGCHRKEAEEWRGSDHELAMQEPTRNTVLGNFNSSSFSAFGITSRFSEREGKFYVTTDGADGRLSEFQVRYVFGVRPLQQYLIELPGGRIQALGIAWDTKGKKWFHLYPKEKIVPNDPLHWTKIYQNWNFMCADCHSTHVQRNYDPGTDSYKTTWDLINVGCQACHGPAEKHVAWASAQEHDRGNDTTKGLLVRLKDADSRTQLEACAPCHARRHRIAETNLHSGPLLDRIQPALLTEDLYFPDGQIRDEVYEYGSFTQSKMYEKGVKCSDCHDPHTLRLRHDGNEACMTCHGGGANKRFPTLPVKNFNSPKHHFHVQGSAGAQCVNCHMPVRTYMVVDDRRDHGFRIPRPDLSIKYGTPNACTQCHAGKDAGWADRAMEKWYGASYRNRPSYAGTLSAARAGQPGSEDSLAAWISNPSTPAIVRATMLELLRNFHASGATIAIQSLRDPDPLVRAAAIREVETLPPSERIEHAGPLLSDPIRAVRMEAARVLLDVQAASFTPEQSNAFQAALAEYESLQLAESDAPGANLNLGVLYASGGRSDDAIASYLNAIRIDSTFVPARVNLAGLYNGRGENAKAETQLREALKLSPENREVSYSLGLLLAEEKRFTEAENALRNATAAPAARPRMYYNYALVLQETGKPAEAERALGLARQLNPNDEEIAFALALLYYKQQKTDEAYRLASSMIESHPDHAGARQLVNQIKAERSRSR